ncbi:hypothetical protein HDR60_00835 [bacterium]|nr:hypothetical protein [bacterium]
MNTFETMQTMLKDLLHNIRDYLKKKISKDNKKGLKELENILIETSSEIERIKKTYSALELYKEKDHMSMRKYLLNIDKILKKISELSRNFKIAHMSQNYYDKIFTESDKLKQILIDLKEFNQKNLLDRLENIVNNKLTNLDNIEELRRKSEEKYNQLKLMYSETAKNYTNNYNKSNIINNEQRFSLLKPNTYSAFGILFFISILWILIGIGFFIYMNYNLIQYLSKVDNITQFINKDINSLKNILKICFFYKLPFFVFCISPVFILLNEAYKQKNRRTINLYFARIDGFIEQIKNYNNKDIAIKNLIEYLASNLSNNKKDILSSKDLKRILKFLEQIKVFDSCCGCLPKQNPQSED